MNNDLISREALLKRIDEEREYLIVRGQTWAEHILVHNFRDLVEDAPTFEDRPTGHWMPKECNFYWFRQFACSECEHEIICREKTPNYCEKCGADMRGEQR